MTNLDVFDTKFKAYQLFCMSIKRLSLMIKTCALSIFHKDLGVTTPKQYPHYVKISLSKIYHEYFEIHIQHTIFFHDPIWVFSPSTSMNPHPQIACHKLQWLKCNNKKYHKHGNLWLSTIGHVQWSNINHTPSKYFIGYMCLKMSMPLAIS
jgi:hypothetical protein